MPPIFALAALLKHRAEYGFGSGDVIGCHGCTWKPQHHGTETRWVEYVAHLPRLVDPGELVLTNADIELLREMNISPGTGENL